MAEDQDSSVPIPTDQDKNNTNGDNDGSDSGSDLESNSDDDEAGDELQLQTLETELGNNPGNYDTHVQYIRALRKQWEIEKLRIAREKMNELFPLTPGMWQEWVNDERSLNIDYILVVIQEKYGSADREYLFYLITSVDPLLTTFQK